MWLLEQQQQPHPETYWKCIVLSFSPNLEKQKLTILQAFLIQAEAGEPLSEINMRRLNGDVVLFFCSFSIGEKISSISWFNLNLFTVKTKKVQVFLVHLGKFWEKHFNMLSTHTHTHTHTPHTYDFSVICSNKVKLSEWGLGWNLEPSLSCLLNEGEHLC